MGSASPAAGNRSTEWASMKVRKLDTARPTGSFRQTSLPKADVAGLTNLISCTRLDPKTYKHQQKY